MLITAVAGLAVLGALVTSVVNAMEDPAQRISTIVTFLVVASGVVLLGVGSAFWGLVVGALVYAWLGWRRRTSPTE
ncbi:MAG: benzoate/H(+) symporter BenE family transporter [Lacisediminihabitans sp.]